MIDRPIAVYWCPICNVQTSGPFHTLNDGGLFPQSATEHECVKVEVLPRDDVVHALERKGLRLLQGDFLKRDGSRTSLYLDREDSVTVIPRDELIEALRSNVSGLQVRLNRTQLYANQVTEKNKRRKAQNRIDHEYIDKLKANIELARAAINMHMEPLLDDRDDIHLMDALAFLEEPRG